VQTVGVVFSTVDETIMSRFLGDINGLTTMRVMVAVNGGTGRGGPTGGAGTLTVMCGPTAAYTVALSAGGTRPYTYISPSFTCAASSALDINVKATAANAPVVIRQLEILHGH
jgi:spore coat protein U-like protein